MITKACINAANGASSYSTSSSPLLYKGNLPPTTMKIAVIIETFPSTEGHVRVATVKNSSG
jgi:hypothetical protein